MKRVFSGEKHSPPSSRIIRNVSVVPPSVRPTPFFCRSRPLHCRGDSRKNLRGPNFGVFLNVNSNPTKHISPKTRGVGAWDRVGETNGTLFIPLGTVLPSPVKGGPGRRSECVGGQGSASTVVEGGGPASSDKPPPYEPPGPVTPRGCPPFPSDILVLFPI